MNLYRNRFLHIGMFLSSFVISVFLGFLIYNRSISGRLPARFVMGISKKNLLIEDQKLTYFYEPSPNTALISSPDWLGTSVTNSINADSIESMRTYSPDKPDKTMRIITLGDSFTYGAYVNTNENYSSVLEAELNTELFCPRYKTFEVINLGMYGYDVAYSLRRLEKRGVKYHPDLVLWLLNRWNMDSINEERIPLQDQLNKKGLLTYDPESKTNPAVNQAIDQIASEFGKKAIQEYQKNALSQLKKIYDGPVIIMYFQEMPEKTLRVIKDGISSNPHVSLLPLFRYDSDTSIQLPDHHPNRLGHQKIAQAIFGSIKSHTLKSSCALKQ